MTTEQMKEQITEQASELYAMMSTLYKNVDHPNYNDLLTAETYLNIILRMIEGA